VAKPEWGTKRICLQCSTRYYDMKKNPPVCPSCGAVFDTESLTKSRRSRTVVEEKPRKVATSPEDIDDLPIVEDDTDDAVIEDADELGEDDIDVEDVVDIKSDDDDDSR